MSTAVTPRPDERGRFGPYGGRYAPEILIPALDELATAWEALRDDPTFRGELGGLLADFVGRPTPITHAARLSEELGQTIVRALFRHRHQRLAKLYGTPTARGAKA